MLRTRSVQALALVLACFFLAVAAVPNAALAGDVAATPKWSTTGTRWDVQASPALSASEVDRFGQIWTERFLDNAGLQAYLNTPGVANDGFNSLSDSDKAFLVVSLVQHWQSTIPSFGKGFWTGDAGQDQKKFNELATMLYATIFAKDEFVAGLRSAFESRGAPMDPSAQVDAGIPEFPGMSQEQITSHFEALQAAERIVAPRPAAQTFEGPIVDVAEIAAPSERPIPITSEIAPPALLDEILGFLPIAPKVSPIDPIDTLNTVANTVATGTYLACASYSTGIVTCAPAAVPLGVPVLMNVDNNLLTGVGGMDVAVLLTPTINPDFPTGFSAKLSVTRTEPSTLPVSTSLPAQVYVVYGFAPSNVQIVAGFDARTGKLGDTNDVTVTLEDTARALAGDVRLKAVISRGGPISTESLIAGFSKMDVTQFPTVTSDPTTASVQFAPMPTSLTTRLRFDNSPGQNTIYGTLDATSSTVVNAHMVMAKGATRRDMTVGINSLPTHIDFTVVSQAVGATQLKYTANSAFTSFTFHDFLTPNVGVPSSYSTMDADVQGVPSSIQFDITRPFNVAYTASNRVTSATVSIANFDSRGLVQSFAGHVEGIPAQWSIGGSSGSSTSMTYSANGVLNLLAGSMYDRGQALSMSASATGIPANLAVYSDGTTSRVSATPAVTSVSAYLSKNGGSAPIFSGNHVSAVYQQTSSSATDVIGASFRMAQVAYAEYKKVGTQSDIDLRMGGGGAFTAYADVRLVDTTQAYLYSTLSTLPTSIQAAFGETTTVTTNANPDLYAYAQVGKPAAITATPYPPYVHGVSVRDGASGSDRAIKASLYLTGLPTGVTIDSRNNYYSITNWRPTINSLVADVQLDNFVSPALNAYVSLGGIPNPQSLTFKMTTADLGAGAKQTKMDLTTTAAMGALFADATFGVNHGRLTVSNIPKDIHATYTIANGQTTFAWDATAAISSIGAYFRVTSQSASFQGGVSLTDLPSDFTLVFGRDGTGDGPTMSYSANASTLDVSAFCDASLFGGDLKARLSFGISNLGASVSVYSLGDGIRFTSSPATGSVYANVWATYNYYKSDSGIWDQGGFLEFPWSYHLGVTPTVNNLATTLSSFSDFSMKWGVTSKLSGTYGAFSLGWSSFTVGLNVGGAIHIVVDWPWPFGSSDITLVDYSLSITIPVNVLFHKYTNHEGYWFGTSGSIICDWSLSTTIKPHPHGAEWNGFSTSSASAEGGAWYITPNPYGWVPTWAVDLVARYTTPDGGSGPGLSFDYNCF